MNSPFTMATTTIPAFTTLPMTMGQRRGPTLQEFLGPSLEDREYALAKAAPARRTIPLKAA